MPDSRPHPPGLSRRLAGTDNTAFVVGLAYPTATIPVAGDFDSTHNGPQDVLAARVMPDGNIVLPGITESSQASLTALGGPDLTYGGNLDGFVASLDPSGTLLRFAGHVGGSAGDRTLGVAFDPYGAVYACGTTSSTQTSFPPVVGSKLPPPRAGRVRLDARPADQHSFPRSRL